MIVPLGFQISAALVEHLVRRAALYAIHCVLRVLIRMRILRVLLGCTQTHRNKGAVIQRCL